MGIYLSMKGQTNVQEKTKHKRIWNIKKIITYILLLLLTLLYYIYIYKPCKTAWIGNLAIMLQPNIVISLCKFMVVYALWGILSPPQNWFCYVVLKIVIFGVIPQNLSPPQNWSLIVTICSFPSIELVSPEIGEKKP